MIRFGILLAVVVVFVSPSLASREEALFEPGATRSSRLPDSIGLRHAPDWSVVDVMRSLALGDFASLNTVITDSVFNFANTTAETEILSSNITVYLTEIQCWNVSVGDMNLNWAPPTQATPSVNGRLNVTHLDATCSLRFEFDTFLGTQSGGITIFTDNNEILTNVSIVKSALDSAPRTALFHSCNTTIAVTDLEFSSDTSSLLKALKSTFVDVVRNNFGTVLCNEVIDIGSTLGTLINETSSTIVPYLRAAAAADPTQPLALERALVAPKGVTLLNLQKPGEDTVGVLAKFVLEELGGLLGSMGQDTDGKSDLNINILLRYLLDADSGLELDLSLLATFLDPTLVIDAGDLGKGTLITKSAYLYGLDSFTRFDKLAILGNYTVTGGFAVDSVLLRMEFELSIEPAGAEQSLVETVLVEIPVTNVDLSGAVLAAIDAEKAGQLTLGSFTSANNLLDSLSSSFYKLQASTVLIASFDITAPMVSGMKSPGLQRLTSAGVEMLYAAYAPVVPSAIAGFFLTTDLTELLSNFTVGRMLAEKKTYVDFRDLLLQAGAAEEYGAGGKSPYGDIFPWVKDAINGGISSVNNDTGRLRINDILIVPFTEAQSGIPGSFVFKGTTVDVDTSITVSGEELRLRIKLDRLRVENLDTISPPVSLLDPIHKQPHDLNNSLAFAGEPIRLSGDIAFGITQGDAVLQNAFNVSLEVISADLILTFLAMVAEEDFLQFPIADVLELKCWLATIPSPELDRTGRRKAEQPLNFAISDLAVSIDEFGASLECHNCTGPRFVALSEMLAKPESRVELTDVVQSAVDAFLDRVKTNSGFFQIPLDRMIADASRFCPHSPEYDPRAFATEYESVALDESGSIVEFLIVVAAVIGALFLVAFVLLICVKVAVRRRHRRWLKSLSRENIMILSYHETEQRKLDNEMNLRSKSLFTSSQIPLITRYAIPVIVVANVGLFLSGHLNLGGSVRIYLQIGGQDILIDNFYKFSIARSTIELWNAGGRAIAILIAIFSGVWPYTKQFITLVVWFLPPTSLSIKRRGNVLLWLDALAKWSMVDVFVLIVSITVFRINIASPGWTFVPEDLYEFDLVLEPLWGLYANFAAQLLSQVSSHFIIFYHRRVHASIRNSIIGSADDEFDERSALGEGSVGHRYADNSIELSYCDGDDDDHPAEGTPKAGVSEGAKSGLESEALSDGAMPSKRIALREYGYGQMQVDCVEKLHPRAFTSYVVAIVALGISALIILGSYFVSFRFEILGLVGFMQRIGQDEADGEGSHSVFSIIALMWEQAQFVGAAKDFIGLGSISIVMALTTVVVPIVEGLALVALWTVSLSATMRRRLEITIEILQAWQYVDVFLIAILVGVWQLGTISELLFNSYCSDLDSTFDTLVSYGILKPKDAQCFAMEGSFGKGTYFLLAAAACLAVLNFFVTHAASQVRDEHDGVVNSRIHLKDVKTDATVNADLDSGAETESTVEKVSPRQPTFSDTFRWLLRKV